MAIGRKSPLVVSVAFGQRRESRAVEVHSTEVHVIRILLRPDAARAEPDLPTFVIHAFHAAHDPLATGNLVLDFAGFCIVKVKMIPAVAFAHPDDFSRFVQVVSEAFRRVIDERRALLVDDGARLSAGRVHLDDPQRLMAALVVQKREAFRIRGPSYFRDTPCDREQFVADLDLRARLQVEQARSRHWHTIPRLCVVEGL